MRNLTVRALRAVFAVFALLAAGCGDDGATTGDDASTDAVDSDTDGDSDAGPANACSEEGCAISITEVTADGDELVVTWSTNFGPDLARNHIHIYWDTFTADEVSSDAESRDVDQGDWVPTDDNPTHTTAGAASVAARGASTTLCVTAADLDHVVIDSSLFDCRDVSELL